MILKAIYNYFFLLHSILLAWCLNFQILIKVTLIFHQMVFLFRPKTITVPAPVQSKLLLKNIMQYAPLRPETEYLYCSLQWTQKTHYKHNHKFYLSSHGNASLNEHKESPWNNTHGDSFNFIYIFTSIKFIYLWVYLSLYIFILSIKLVIVCVFCILAEDNFHRNKPHRIYCG